MEQAISKTLYIPARYSKTEYTGRLEKLREDAIFYVIAGTDGSRRIKIKPKPEYTFYVANEDLGYHRLS